MSDDRLTTPGPSEKIARTEIIISKLLRAGMLTSLIIVAVGMVVMFVHHPEYVRSPEALGPLRRGENPFPKTLGAIFHGAWNGQAQGRSIVLIGVFALFLTPVLRVVASIVTFVIERDWAFAAITACVLCFLILSLVLGKAG